MEQNASARAGRGFTLIEMMIVVAVMAILAMVALPSVQGRVVRAQVAEARATVQFAQQAIQAQYAASGALPADNAAAALPPADHIVSKLVSGVVVHGGALVITFGNQANRALAGHRLSLRPAVVDGYPQVPISWVCGAAPVPDKMALHVADESDLPAAFMPLDCRGPATAP